MLDETTLYALIAPCVPEYNSNVIYSPEGGSVGDKDVRLGKLKFNEIRGKVYNRICNEWDLCH